MSMATSAAFTVLSVLSAVAATVLACIFILPEKKRAKLNKLGQLLHDIVNFKFLIIEKILQVLYIFITAFTVFMGFFMLFSVRQGYYSDTWMGGYGLLLMILGPIVIRLFYELFMMAILLVKNVIQINNKIKNQNGDEETNPFKALDISTFKAEAKPETENVPKFCVKCGSPITDGKCPNCDNN